MAGNSMLSEQNNAIASTQEPIVLATKISIPARRTALIDRAELVRRIDSNKAHSRLTVIVAPAGFGKTTIARQWALSNREPIAWLSLDAGDNDVTRFLTYLTMAVRKVFPEFGEGFLALLRSSQPPTREILVTALLNALCHLAEPVSVVLDDYHLIGECHVHDSVTFLLDHLPTNVHFLIASRVDPPLALARLRARGELTELRTADLRCGAAEAADFLRGIMGLQLTEADLTALSERTEGWMAGLQLAGLSLQRRDDPADFIRAFTGSNRYIVDYLGEEVLRQQPDDIRRFLYRTSILDRLHGPLCEAVTGDLPCGKGQAILEQMETANLFLIALDDNRRWYRYHHLFGDMLRARLLLEGEEEVSELHRRAFVWYEGAGIMEQAIPHALAGKHFDDAIRLMERTVDDLWRRGEGFMPQRWLSDVPADLLRKSVVLVLFRARFFVVTADPQSLAGALNDAERLLLEQNRRDPILWGQYKALRAFEATFFERDDEAIRLAEEGLAILPTDGGMWIAVLQVLLATIHAERGDVEAGLRLCLAAATECERLRDLQVTVIARALEGTFLESQGFLQRAEEKYRRALEFTQECKVERLPISAAAYSGLGSIALERLQLDAARAHLETAYELAKEIDASDSRFRTAYLLVRLLTLLGDFEGANQITAELCHFAAKRSFQRATLLAEGVRAHFHLGTNQIDLVERWMGKIAEKSGANCDDDLLRFLLEFSGPPSLQSSDLMASNLVRLRYVQGRFEETVKLAGMMIDRMEQQGRPGSAVPIRVLLAIAQRRMGHIPESIATLSPALLLAEPEGFVLPFVHAGKEIAPLLRESTPTAPDSRFIQEVLSRVGSSNEEIPSVPSPNGSPLTETLTDREIEVLRHVASGMSNQDIADKLFLSVGTVKRHMHNIFVKLDAESRVSAIARARSIGIPI